jgi:hypothetical protein
VARKVAGTVDAAVPFTGLPNADPPDMAGNPLMAVAGPTALVKNVLRVQYGLDLTLFGRISACHDLLTGTGATTTPVAAYLVDADGGIGLI